MRCFVHSTHVGSSQKLSKAFFPPKIEPFPTAYCFNIGACMSAMFHGTSKSHPCKMFRAFFKTTKGEKQKPLRLGDQMDRSNEANWPDVRCILEYHLGILSQPKVHPYSFDPPAGLYHPARKEPVVLQGHQPLIVP